VPVDPFAELPPPTWTAPVEPVALLPPEPLTFTGADTVAPPAVAVGDTEVGAT
jgi:hypothetical protein